METPLNVVTGDGVLVAGTVVTAACLRLGNHLAELRCHLQITVTVLVGAMLVDIEVTNLAVSVSVIVTVGMSDHWLVAMYRKPFRALTRSTLLDETLCSRLKAPVPVQ